MKQFTDQERQSLMVEALLQEITPEDKPKMDTLWDLLAFLHREKERVLKLLMAGNQKERLVLWPELDAVKADIKELEDYFKLLSTKQDN